MLNGIDWNCVIPVPVLCHGGMYTYIAVGAELFYDNRAWYLLEHVMQKKEVIHLCGNHFDVDETILTFVKGQAKARGNTRMKLGRPYL